jgi:2,4-dienoyl-CoA reductase-like NADH-dependent reductase (Old Yellow Enzyme family)
MLFEPISFSGLELENRLVRSATYEKRADEDGHVTEHLIDLYEELARGGAGLIITGNALVHPSGRTVPQMLSVHSDIYLDGLKRLTDRVHALGGVIALQVVHGGRQCPPVLLGGAQPMAPSEVYEPVLKVSPRAMSNEEVWQMVEAFAQAARRAQLAGFDAVQIHGAHGYLVSQFLSPYTNRRDDYWGGDAERRFHFLEEVYKAMRQEVGSLYPILIKLNGDDLLPGGLQPQESLQIARRLQDMGIAAVEISGGMIESEPKPVRPNILRPEQEAYFRPIGALFKRNLQVPVILTGGMRSRAVMEQVLREGAADMVGLSRPFIREPNLPQLLRQGKERADCISCNKCMRFMRLDFVKCVALIEKDQA